MSDAERGVVAARLYGGINVRQPVVDRAAVESAMREHLRMLGIGGLRLEWAEGMRGVHEATAGKPVVPSVRVWTAGAQYRAALEHGGELLPINGGVGRVSLVDAAAFRALGLASEQMEGNRHVMIGLTTAATPQPNFTTWTPPTWGSPGTAEDWASLGIVSRQWADEQAVRARLESEQLARERLAREP